ncbi:PH domain-containing protein [Bacteroidota bacterium]
MAPILISILDSPIFWLIIVIIILELYRIQSYSIFDNKLIIKRRIKSIKINLSDILKIEEIKYRKTFMFFRFFGVNAGPWNKIGIYGIFWKRKYGLVHVYLKDRNNVLLIFLKSNRKIMISPSKEMYDTILEYF